MKFGLAQQELNFLTKNLVDPMKAMGCRVFIFGSRARGDFQKFSDVDIMIDSKKDLTLAISQKKELFSNSNFPYKIDIVQLKDFAESYKDNYESEKIEL
jgi:predicted nucleotidyltransferase